MKNPLIYVLINGELKMSPGKAAAQAVHAAMMLSADAKHDFLSNHRRTVIILEAKNAMQLQNLSIYLDEAEVECQYYIDEGVNEIDAYSITALAVGPLDADDEENRNMFEAFPLYGGHVTVRLDRDFSKEGSLTIPNNLTINRKVFKDLKENLK